MVNVVRDDALKKGCRSKLRLHRCELLLPFTGLLLFKYLYVVDVVVGTSWDRCSTSKTILKSILDHLPDWFNQQQPAKSSKKVTQSHYKQMKVVSFYHCHILPRLPFNLRKLRGNIDSSSLLFKYFIYSVLIMSCLFEWIWQ